MVSDCRLVRLTPSTTYLAAAQETGKSCERGIRHMVFNTLCIKLRAVLWHTNGDEKIDHQTMTVADFRSER